MDADRNRVDPIFPLSFHLFVFFFALSTLYDTIFKNPSVYVDGWLRLAVPLAAVWLLFRPSSFVRMATLATLQIGFIVQALPRVPNHFALTLGIDITLLIMAGHACYLRLKAKPWDESIYGQWAFPLRLALFALYFWAVVHKLNWDFFDPSTSCAVRQLFNILNRTTYFDVPEWTYFPAIYGTILFEALIPIGLFFSRFRSFGLILGVLFHLPLGFTYIGFTLMLFAIFCAFLPLVEPRQGWDLFPFSARIRTPLLEVAQRVRLHKLWWLWSSLLTPAIVVFFSLVGAGLSVKIIYLAAGFYFLLFLWKNTWKSQGSPFFHRVHVTSWVVPLFTFALGTLPYLGVKNVQVFAMFSNLQTEGGQNNHFFIPSSIRAFKNLDRLVKVKSSNDTILHAYSQPAYSHLWNSTDVIVPRPYLRKYGGVPQKFRFLLPYSMLQNRITNLRLNGFEGVQLTYELGGEIYRTSQAERDPDLAYASWFQRKFLLQKGVPIASKALCMW